LIGRFALLCARFLGSLVFQLLDHVFEDLNEPLALGARAGAPGIPVRALMGQLEFHPVREVE
jgi:hypothetical protein